MIRLRSFITVFLLILPLLTSCYDDTEIWKTLQDHEARITNLEEFCKQLNTNIVSLRDIIGVLESRDYIKDVVPLIENSAYVGYSLTFNNRKPIIIYNGKKGDDAVVPHIGIKRDLDGIWYWTLDGEWILDDEGSKIRANGEKGDSGKDGIVPRLKIEEEYWWVSYDYGETWDRLGQATGQPGKEGDSMFDSVSQDDHFVYLKLVGGEIIQLAKYISKERRIETVHNIENKAVQAYQKVIYNNNDYSYSCVDYLTSSSLGTAFDVPSGEVVYTDIDLSAAYREIVIADNPGFLNSRIISLDLSSDSYTLYNLAGGKNYYYRVYKDHNPYLLLNSGEFATIGTVRFLRIKASKDYEHNWLKNVRDIGGWKVNGNREIRYGAIIRGYEPNHISNGVKTVFVSNTGLAELRKLGINAQLDLRGIEYAENEQGKMMDGFAYACVPLDLWFYRLNIYCKISKSANAFANAIRQIIVWLREGRGIYVHCKGGCDRTGALCAIIEGLCGVSENDINHDYELSNRNRSREYYSLAKGDSYDGDFKYAMEYVKGLL